MPHLSRACLLALIALPASAGLGACAAWGPAAREETDAGPAAPFLDASASLGDGDVGPVFAGEAAGAPAELDETSGDSSGGRTSCLDFEDNDDDGILDCDEPTCRSLARNGACCVGSTATDCCVDAAPVEVAPLATCSGAAARCLGVGGVELTATLGQVFDGALVTGACAVASPAAFAPIGSAGSHGVMALPTSLSTETSYVSVQGRLGASDISDVRVSAAGFGLFRPQDLGVLARPLVAVIVSATADEVRVVVGDRVIATETLGVESCDRSAEYQVSTSPDGHFVVRRRAAGATEWESRIVADGTFDGGTDLRVAMFGQQPNPTDAPTAWVSGLEVHERACDVLAPAREAGVVAGDRDHDVTGIAVFPRDATGDAWEALVTAGDQIHWMAVQRSTGGLVSSTPGAPFADNIQPAAWPVGYQHVEDIEVFRDTDGTLRVLLAAAPTADAPTVIIATTYTPSPTPGRPGALGTMPREVLDASVFPTLHPTDGESVTPVSVDGPTARRVEALASPLFLARVRYSDGHSEIRVVPPQPDNAAGFESADPDASGRDADGVTTDGLVHASQPGDAAAFDRDEVADPQIVEAGGVVRVLYAGRRGTRWSIGTIVASPAVTHFVPVSREPQLAPTGAGFDALGVSEPQLVLRDETQWLYFAGSDGARRGIGVAHQPVIQESSR